MTRRGLVVAAALGLASAASANSIAPTFYFWPGVLPMMLGLALPGSVLAALLERPFVARAGVLGSPLLLSLQANAVSLGVGYLTLPIFGEIVYMIGPLWSPIAVFISIAVESGFLDSRAVSPPARLRRRWIAAGNVVSSLVLILIPSVAMFVANAKPYWPWNLRPYEDPLYWTAVAASLAVFVWAFIAWNPAASRNQERLEPDDAPDASD